MTELFQPELLITAFMMGLASSTHCLMMCGGISQSLCTGIQTDVKSADQSKKNHPYFKIILFHLGRLLCYSLLGVIVAYALFLSQELAQIPVGVFRVIAAGLIIVTGLYLIGVLDWIKKIESSMSFIWSSASKQLKPFLAMEKNYHALIVGMLWGLLPCGIIYTTVLWAATQTRGYEAGFLMFFFGLGTLPAMLSLNLFGFNLWAKINPKHIKWVSGLFLLILGLSQLYFAIEMLNQAGHQHHHHH